jgi:hypothetical protein
VSGTLLAQLVTGDHWRPGGLLDRLARYPEESTGVSALGVAAVSGVDHSPTLEALRIARQVCQGWKRRWPGTQDSTRGAVAGPRGAGLRRRRQPRPGD